MIPSYNAPDDYLEQTLRSVLAQDPGPGEMQIEVVDDCSPNGPPMDLVNRLAGGRVSLHREPRNLGLAGIWNRCVERARGHWVHILHQDDLVLPGFYAKLRAGADSPAAPGLLFCRYAYLDADGHWLGLSPIEARTAGALNQALERLARQTVIQTPSVVVRRSIYESLGGFRSDLVYTLDWEMWCRVAAKYPVWFEPGILAGYRLHQANATRRLVLEGKDIEDSRKCIGIISNYLPDAATEAQVRRHALKLAALGAAENAWSLFRKKLFAAAFRQFKGAFKCGFPLTVLWRLVVLASGTTTRVAKRKALHIIKPPDTIAPATGSKRG